MIIALMGTAGAGKDTAGAIIAKELGGVTMAFADPIKRFCMNALKLTERQLWGDQKEKPISKAQLKALEPKPYKGPVKLLGPDAVGIQPWSYALSAACDASFIPPRTEIGYVRYADDSMHRLRERGMREWWNSLKAEKGLTPRRVMQHFGTEYVRQQLGEEFWTKTGLSATSKLLRGGFNYSPKHGLIETAGARQNVVVLTDVRFRNEVLAVQRAGGRVYRIERHGGSRTALKGHASEVEQASVPQFWLNGTLINRYDTAAEFEEAIRYFTRSYFGGLGGAVN